MYKSPQGKGGNMEEKCKCGCLLPWLSGFFGAPVIAHIIRIFAKWDVTLNGEPISMKTSWVVVIVTAILSILFGILACKRHKNSDTAGGSSACC